jgi:hypothetical protein
LQYTYIVGFTLGFYTAKAEMTREVNETVNRLNAATAEMHVEMGRVRSELARLRTLDGATVDTERDAGA